MKERPILFSGPMVKATLSGLKTKTRRTKGLGAINMRPDGWRYDGINVDGHHLFFDINARVSGWDVPDCITVIKCPYGKPRDYLWGRETWTPVDLSFREPAHYVLLADNKGKSRAVIYKADGDYFCEWTPSIHMPRWASRILLEIVSVRVERLQDISDVDARAEGIEIVNPEIGRFANLGISTYRSLFSEIWDGINSKRGFGWDVNPWIWVIEFKQVEQPA